MDEQQRSAVRTINAGKARVNLGQMLDEVFYKGDHFIIERDGRPMAAVIPLSRFAALPKHSDQAKPEPVTSKGNKRRSHKG